jgi:glycosyltransferase involved in cell wall biosynthesis
MRLGLDLLFLIPDETGGRETYARELIAAMFEIDPGLTATAFVNRESAAVLVRNLGSAMRVVRLPVSARRPEQWALGELALLPAAGARARIDVLHSLANFAPATGRFRRVVTVHDLQYRAVPELLPRTRRAGTAALLGLAARRAHRIVTVSAFSRDQIVSELAIGAERVEVIPNGVSAPRPGSAVPERELRERHRLAARPVALGVATDLPHKNLGAAIDALALIPPERRPLLVLVGAGTDGAALRARAGSAGVEADVRLLGFRSREELEGFYGLAACVIVPSLYEGFGLPVIEAMVRGIPVACSDIAALREVAGNAAIRFSPLRSSEIATALGRLIEDAALARRLAAAGRERAARFNWASTASATLACYRRVLEPPV